MKRNTSGDAPCYIKAHVEELKSGTYRALEEAVAAHEDPKVIKELGEVLAACNRALARVRPTQGYVGGRLETSASEVASSSATAFVEKHPRFAKILEPGL